MTDHLSSSPPGRSLLHPSPDSCKWRGGGRSLTREPASLKAVAPPEQGHMAPEHHLSPQVHLLSSSIPFTAPPFQPALQPSHCAETLCFLFSPLLLLPSFPPSSAASLVSTYNSPSSHFFFSANRNCVPLLTTSMKCPLPVQAGFSLFHLLWYGTHLLCNY